MIVASIIAIVVGLRAHKSVVQISDKLKNININDINSALDLADNLPQALSASARVQNIVERLCSNNIVQSVGICSQ